MAEEKKKQDLPHESQFKEATQKRDDSNKALQDATDKYNAKEKERVAADKKYKAAPKGPERDKLLEEYYKVRDEALALKDTVTTAKKEVNKQKTAFTQAEKKYKADVKTYQQRESNLGIDIGAYSEAVRSTGQAVLDTEKELRPEFTDLNLADTERFLKGTPDQAGMFDISKEAQEQTQAQLEAGRQAEVANIADGAEAFRDAVSQLSPEQTFAVEQAKIQAERSKTLESEYQAGLTGALDKYAPDTSRAQSTLGGLTGLVGPTISEQQAQALLPSTLGGINALVSPTLEGFSGQVGSTLGGINAQVGPTVSQINLQTGNAQTMADEAFGRRGQLSPEEMRNAQQAAREAAAASGRIGGNAGIAAEAMNRESAMAARRAEASQALSLAFDQQFNAAQAKLGAEQALYGQKASDVERNIQLQQARYGQSAADIERNIQLQQARFDQGLGALQQQLTTQEALYGQKASDVERQTSLEQARFDQDAAARAQQLEAQQVGYNQYLTGQAGLQAIRDEQAGRYAGLADVASETYTTPGMDLYTGTPTAVTGAGAYTNVGLGAIGSGTPQLVDTDAGLDVGMTERTNKQNAKNAKTAADAQEKAGIVSGVAQGVGTAVGAALV